LKHDIENKFMTRHFVNHDDKVKEG